MDVVPISKISVSLSRRPCSSVSSFIRQAASSRPRNSSANPVASLVGSAERIERMTSANGTTRKISSRSAMAPATVRIRVSALRTPAILPSCVCPERQHGAVEPRWNRHTQRVQHGRGHVLERRGDLAGADIRPEREEGTVVPVIAREIRWGGRDDLACRRESSVAGVARAPLDDQVGRVGHLLATIELVARGTRSTTGSPLRGSRRSDSSRQAARARRRRAPAE